MVERHARSDSLGLVIAPPSIDCVGLECRVALQKGRCFIDKHHLYFSEDKFTTRALTEEFRNHPFNKIKIPRCRHNQYHTQVDTVRIPSDSVMETFLDEAELLRQLGVVTREVLKLELRLVSEDTRDIVRLAYATGGPLAFTEKLQEHQESQSRILDLVGKFEVFPERQLFGSHVIGARAIWGAEAA